MTEDEIADWRSQREHDRQEHGDDDPHTHEEFEGTAEDPDPREYKDVPPP
jgi:hypothetical protein